MNTVTRQPALVDLQVFRAMPGNSLLLLPNAPEFTIVAATEGYLQVTGRSLEDIRSKAMLQAFPTNPAGPEMDEATVMASLIHVLRHKTPHEQVFRYDITRAGGVYEERHWQIQNKPVLDDTDTITFLLHTVEDITARVKTAGQEDLLKGVEKSYRDLVNAPILLCIVKGPDYQIAMANEQSLRYWNQSNAVIGKPILKVFPELQTQGFPEILARVQSTGQAESSYEHPVTLLKNGQPETRYLDFIFQPYFEQEHDTAPSGVTCVAHDQTVQVEARKKAEESEHRFRDLITEADVATAIYFGREMRIRYANAAMIRLWGKDNAVIGKTVREALPELEGQPFHALLEHVFTTGETYWGKEDRGELVVDGERKTFYFNFTYKALRTADGEIYGILNMATDVTEQVVASRKLQESERNLRNTILQAPVAMSILTGPDHVVSIANNRIYELWGRPPADMFGKPLFEGLPEVRHQGFEALLHHVYTTGETYRGREAAVNLPRNGRIETLYVSFVYEPFRGGDGIIAGVIVVAIDVTEQVLARKAVEASEQRVRSAVASAPFPIAVYTGREMRIEMANQSIIDVWGKGPDVVGKTYAALLPELAGSGIFEQLDQVYTTGAPFHTRNQQVDLVVGGKLQPFYFNYSFTPLFDADGSIYGVMNTAAEITDIVLARQKIEQSEERFQNLVREAPVGIVVLTGETLTVSVVNNSFARLIGRSAEALLHRKLFDVIPEMEEIYRPLVEKTRLKGEPIYLYEQSYRVSAAGGTIEGYLNAVYQPYRETDGTITGVMVLCQDVTPQVLARQKAEEAQETARLAVDAAGLGTFDVDLLTNQLIASQRLDAIFDVDHHHERDRYVKAIHPDDLPIRAAAYEQAYRDGHLAYEARVLLKSGATRWIRAIGRVFFEEEKPVKLVGVAQDITEEKNFAEALSRKVGERTQELEQFLFVSHHDLQEPLRKIILFSDMLKTENQQLLSETSNRRLDKVMDAARRMSAALRDVLDFASLSRDPVFDQVDLNQVLHLVLSDVEVAIAEKEATIKSDHLPTLYAVPQQVHQLVYNLISNALKFTKPGQPPLITVTHQRLDGEALRRHPDLPGGQAYVQLTVTDNGIGFRQELADKIFTLFQRLHSKEQYAGTGIGLALCKKVVQNHGGKIWAESEEGKGAAFHFILPLQEA